MNSPSWLISLSVDLLINLTLLGASLALTVAITFKFIPASLPRARYLMALAAFCAAALIPILATLGLSGHQPLLSSSLPEATNHMAARANAHPTELASLVIESPPPAQASFRSWMLDFAQLLKQLRLAAAFLWLWAGVSIWLLGRELIGHLSLQRARRRWPLAPLKQRQLLNWPPHIPLYLHPRSGPSAVGWLRPAVVLPHRLLSDLPTQAIRQIAQHELAHARWRDPLANTLLRFVRALLWPSVPLWFLEHLAHAEREAAADQAAIAQARCGPESKQAARAYAASLVSVAEWEYAAGIPRSFSSLGTQAGGGRALTNRIHRLLKTPPKLNPIRAALGLAVLIGGLLCMSWLPVAIAHHPARHNAEERPVDAPRAQLQETAAEDGTHPLFKKPPAREVKEPGATVRLKAVMEETRLEEKEQPAALPSRVVIERDGSTTFIRQTGSGVIEEPILRFRLAEIEAYAIKRVIPSEIEQIVRESGLPGVMVHVVVDEEGNVILAWPLLNDRPFIKQKAVAAARQWKFTPIIRDGRPTKAVGTLAFFGIPDWSKEWYELRF